MNPKLPYYMAYPMPLAYDDEKIERRDFEYMKSLYPSMAKKILPYVEDECDRMEYDCSMMYDEYPDKWSIERTCQRIESQMEMQAQSASENLLGEFIRTLFCQEMYQRRCRRKRCR